MMMMGDMMGTFGSSMASLFFFWATLQQILPDHIKIAFKDFLLSAIQQFSFVQRFFDHIINYLSPYIVINFPEFEDYYHFNHGFAAIDTYLGAQATDKSKKLKASQVKGSKDLILKRDETKVRDVFEGVSVWWEIVTGSEGERSYRVIFHRRVYDIVTGSYLKYVMEQGKLIEAKNKKMKLYTNNPNSDWDSSKKSLWRRIDFEHPASFETLAMDPEKKEEILNDLMAFSNGKEYYKKIGKAWKRGYLLYGPPGTGKSTMIAAMANLLNYSIYDLELTAIQSNSDLRKLLAATSSKSIILIEDIDCSMSPRKRKGSFLSNKKVSDLNSKKEEEEEEEEDGNLSRVTLSGLLNFIDGIWSACGQERIIVFTTNHKERLDPALIRRGRMDMHIELSYCSFEGFKILAKNYLDLDSHTLFGEIESLLKEIEVVPADVAENLMAKNQKIDVERSLNDLVESLKKRKKKQRDKSDEQKKKHKVFGLLF